MNNSIKTARTEYPVIDLIKNRWSPRSFAEKPIKEEIISSLLEAARWAPSAFNEQPWRFFIGIKNNNATYIKVFESLVEFNRNWAKSAPVLIVCCGKKNFAHNDNPNPTAAYDAGQSVAYLTMQALSENIYVHQMTGFDKNTLRNNLNLSDDYEINSVIALGYLDTPDKLPEELKKIETTERLRKDIKDLIL